MATYKWVFLIPVLIACSRGRYPDCNFTNGFKGWTNSGRRSWMVVNSTMKDVGLLTGRQGSGDNFMIIKPSSYSKRGDEAKLYSNEIRGPVCMRFYFYLYGSETGYLKIRTKKPKSVVFNHYGNHGHKWNLAQIYLNFSLIDVYQIAILGKVGDPTSDASIAVDDISFENRTCEELPQASKSFNCTFDTGICGWKFTGKARTQFQSDLNQYTVVGTSWFTTVTLSSPKIFQLKACFTFQYLALSQSYSKNSAIFVFVRNASNGQLLPFWHKNVVHAPKKWHTVKILFDLESGFDEVKIKLIPCCSFVSFANFNLNLDTENCGNIVEKTFFVSTKRNEKEYIISDNGINCNLNNLALHFTATTIPTKKYPKPMYLFFSPSQPPISSNMEDASKRLSGYFYVSDTLQKNSPAIYYSIKKNIYKNPYIADFTLTRPDGNWAGNVMYVKSLEDRKDNGNCPPKYINIMNKCFWLLCDKKNPTDAEYGCSEKLGTLASLDETGFTRITEYLKFTQAINTGITQITVGLSRKSGEWIWNDGRGYNNSKFTLGKDYRNTQSYLTWTAGKWVLQDRKFPARHHLCQQRGENVAYKSLSNQSSTLPGFPSKFAVDGLHYTRSRTQLPKKWSEKAWWKIILDHPAKVFLVTIEWPGEFNAGNVLVTLGLQDDRTSTEFEKRLKTLVTSKSMVIWDPPTLARYVRLETKGMYLELREVGVYATDSLDDIRGVMRRSRTSGAAYDSLNFPPSFIFDNYNGREQESGAYLLAPYRGTYRFLVISTGWPELVIKRHRDEKHFLAKSPSFKEYFSTGHQLRRTIFSSRVKMEACKIYFVKLTTKGADVKLAIEHINGSRRQAVPNKSLFWVLPGKVEINLFMDNSTAGIVPLNYPLNVTGRYSIRCRGLYCGDCPLAVFITFAGQRVCIMTSSQSIAQDDKISLHLKTWFTLPGSKSVHMGYKTDGNCRSILDQVLNFIPDNSTVHKEIGRIDVKPLPLAECSFKRTKLCESETSEVQNHGWRYAEDSTNKKKRHTLESIENMTSSFSYKWIPYNSIVNRTGTCMKFLFKMTGNDSILSLYYQTFSGYKTLLWRLRGNHGGLWKSASITYQPDENFAFIFEGKKIEPNTTVAIARVSVTTVTCMKGTNAVIPAFADPDYQCPSDMYQCDNGECIGQSLACDGDEGCADRSDEIYCKCLTEQFRCKRSGECVNTRQLCDGIRDCEDSSDEKDCHESCDSEHFYCPSGICIPLNLTCNAMWECPSGADEPSVCGDTSRTKQTCSLNDLGCLADSRNGTSCDIHIDWNCDFEKNSHCEWSQIHDGNDDFDWSIHNGPTPSAGTGPLVDHTTGTKEGSYIYIEASPRVEGAKAIIEAGPFKPNHNYCFTFFYHMFGEHIGKLSVYQAWSQRTNLQLLWSRNTSGGNFWRSSSLDIKSGKQFYLLVEAVRGKGAQGDIALDDFSMTEKNCSKVENDVSPFCSFEKLCALKVVRGSWLRRRADGANRFIHILQEHFLSTSSDGELEINLSEESTALYQCMSFWYKFHNVVGMSFTSTQVLGQKENKLSHSVTGSKQQWLFSEMPLQRQKLKSKIALIVLFTKSYDRVNNRPYLAIDEINFSSEQCISFQQGGVAWIKKSSRFFRSLTKRDINGGTTAFYSPPFLSSDLNPQPPSFIKRINPKSVNYIVEDIPLSKYLNVNLGRRVLVEESDDVAVSGIVIAKESVRIHEEQQYKLTVRLVSDGSDIVIEDTKVWLLPYQLDKHGSAWLSSSTPPCKSFSYNGSCYFMSSKRNWFVGADICKKFGSELARFDSELEEKLVKKRFANFLPFWIGYHGHKHAGSKFVWSDGSKDLYNNLDGKSLHQGLSAGLCTVVLNSTLWQRWNCSQRFNVLCRRPDKREKIICEDHGNQTLNCSSLDAIIDVKYAKLELTTCKKDICPTSTVSSNKTKCRPKLDTDILNKVASKCDGKIWCNLSVKSTQGDQRPAGREYLLVSYMCVKKSVVTEADSLATNDVFCPKSWVKFRKSCYKPVKDLKNWDDALASCKQQNGATLASLDDKLEENYVKSIMKSEGLTKFHVWPRSGTASSKRGFVCEYNLGAGSCDFENDWCGWRQDSGSSNSFWQRIILDDQIAATHNSRLDNLRGLPETKEDGVSVYVLDESYKKNITLIAHRPKKIVKVTLCLWVYITADTSEASVVSFGDKLRLKIYYENDHNFRVNFYNWNSITKASVSFQMWQHLCFSINMITKLWTFSKNGLMTDIGVAVKLLPFLPGAISKGDNVIYLGRSSRKSICQRKRDCETMFRGKMTQPEIWSKILNFHEISALANGCGMATSSDITVRPTELYFRKKQRFTHGECITGKGFRLTSVRAHNPSSSTSISTLTSPWMRVPFDGARGVCMTFTYRLLGIDAELGISVEPRNMKKEKLWSVKDPQKNAVWKTGKVSLGIVTEFKVHVKATQRSNESEVNIDNIFFMENFCDPVPEDAQQWCTSISNSSSGYITSPYYPAMYLNNMERCWEIEVLPGQRLKFDWLYLNLEDGKTCEKDSVVFKGSRKSKTIGLFCGNRLHQSFFSPANTAFVVFRSDKINVGTGFKLRYQVVSVDDDSCEGDKVPDCFVTLECSFIRSNKSNVFIQAHELMVIPEYFPVGTTAINFDDNSLVRLGASHFENLTQLEYLSCSNNKISDLDKMAFHDLTTLKTLRLSFNFIQRLPKSLFFETRSLQTLDLGCNWIDDLDTELFSTLNKLRLLSLRKNMLTRLGDGIFSKLTNLEYLYLDSNKLMDIGSSVFDNLSFLKTLILKNNKLTVVQASWLKNKRNLKILDIANNNIQKIEPGAFHYLENLVELDMSDNRLEKIPENLFQNLVSLRNL